MFGIDPGGFVEKVCDKLGLPEEVGDIASLGVNLYVGDYASAVRDAEELRQELADGVTSPRLADRAGVDMILRLFEDPGDRKMSLVAFEASLRIIA